MIIALLIIAGLLIFALASPFLIIIGLEDDEAFKNSFSLGRVIAGMIVLLIALVNGFNANATAIIMTLFMLIYYICFELKGFEKEFKEGYYGKSH